MSLTCNSCKLSFSEPKLHHEHYKCDLHRYNLKRKIAELPPLTEKEFEARATAFEATKEKVSSKCYFCNKIFSSEKAMANHLKSNKHLEAEAAAKNKPKDGTNNVPLSRNKVKNEDADITNENADVTNENASDEEWSDNDSDWESCDEEEEDGIIRLVVDTDDCLFCDHHSDSAESNVSHMSETHSFFIPHMEYVSDLDGLIAYLAGKIQIEHVCLWCNGNGAGFQSTMAVQQHMIDKGHCKILLEGEARFDYVDFYDYSSVVENEIFNTISGVLGGEGHELLLPSGRACIGHRSLAHIYKQNKPVSDKEKKVKKVLPQYKSLGYLGITGQAVVKKARDIVFMQKVKSRSALKLGIKNNKLQPHFRRQIMF